MERNGNVQTERKEILGLTRITKKRLRELCKKDKLYQTPSLNDVLYLHYQGFQCIESLEEYTGLKCLWLESNAISEIQGLENQPKLKCLFLQSNLIKCIENLGHCTELDTLNLASNHIRKVENCGTDILPCLNTLNLSANYLRDHEGLKELENCKTLSVLDLSNNRIDDILVVKVFAKIPQLRVLVLQGNPVVSKLPQYRKTMILACKELTYLDSRPVFPKDRACAEAWKRGGYEEERKENERWNRKERKKMRDSVNATIRLRNRHRGPDRQLSLLTSSDSENELESENKRRREAETDAGVNLEMGFWDEVDDVKSSSSSSDMNVSSSTSVIDTTDSNGNESSTDSKANDTAEILNNSNVEEKIMNDTPERNDKLLDLTGNINVASLLNPVLVNDIAEHSEEDILELKAPTKNVTFVEDISDCKTNEDATDSTVSKTSAEAERDLSSLSSEDECKEDYHATVNAICQITMNDLSQADSPKKRVRLQIEIADTAEDYEPEIMLIDDNEEKTQNRLREESAAAQNDETEVDRPKTLEQLEYEKTCKESNDKVEKDFEELTSRMEDFIAELQSLNERTDVQIFDSSLNDSNASSQNDGEEKQEVKLPGSYEKDHMQMLVVREEAVTALQAKSLESDSVQLLVEQGKDVIRQIVESSDKNAEQFVVEQEADGSSVVTFEKEESSKEKLIESTSEKELDTSIEEEVVDNDETMLEEVQIGDFMPIMRTKLEERNQIALVQEDIEGDKESGDHEKVDSITEKQTADVSGATTYGRANEKTREAFDKEANELKKLLQKLEDENEQLYNINCTYKNMLKENIEEEIKYVDKEASVTTEALCEDIVDELLDDLTLEAPVKLPNYQFIDIESDEEYSYTDKPKPEESVKSIRDVLNSFNDFLETIASKNREEMLRKEQARKKVATTDEEKAASLKELLSGNLKQFSEDADIVDAQFKEIKQRKTQEVKELVDRVYAQRDKYDDTLEVVDGKLVVVKKETGEIEDLPVQSPQYHSDDNEDDDEYDTAQSEDEVDDVWQKRQWDVSNKPCGMWSLPYKPTLRVPAGKLVQDALERHKLEEEEENNENDDGNDRYYSLESSNPGSRLFDNIDEEFFSSLNFDSLQFDETDENRIVECARSYEELRHYMMKSKEEHYLTREEKDLLEKMIERKKTQDSDEQKVIDSACSELTEEENMLLKRMVERTKEKEKEKEEVQKTIKNPGEDMEMKVQRETTRLIQSMAKIFEYGIVGNAELETKDKESGKVHQLDGKVSEGLEIYKDPEMVFNDYATAETEENADMDVTIVPEELTHTKLEEELSVFYDVKDTTNDDTDETITIEMIQSNIPEMCTQNVETIAMADIERTHTSEIDMGKYVADVNRVDQETNEMNANTSYITMEDEILEQLDQTNTSTADFTTYEEADLLSNDEEANNSTNSSNHDELFGNQNQIEFNLEVFNENDVLINEIIVNADITYDVDV